jgi:hypothetical protein
LTPGVCTQLDMLARAFVHWTHAVLVLRYLHPSLNEYTLRKAYDFTLRAHFGLRDPRIPAVFNPDLDIVWGETCWLDAKHLRPTRVDDDVLNAMPHVQTFIHDEKEIRTRVSPARRARLKHREPQGYPPIRPVRGISFNSASSSIPAVVEPKPRFPIELLDDPMPMNDAHQYLLTYFPRLDLRYLQASLAAGICGEARLGQPPMLACTGPTGSGKGQTPRLAASFVGEDIVKLPLSDKDEEFFRHVGAALAAGHRFLVLDELGKTPALNRRIKNLLAISESVSWRPLYQSNSIVTPFRAALFLPCVRFPDFLSKSGEFVRRVRHIHLCHQSLEWPLTCGGDTAKWRDRSEHNAFVANSVLTHTWRLCHDVNFLFQ